MRLFMFLSLRKDRLPPSWQSGYPNIKNVAPAILIEDVARRVEQSQRLLGLPAEKYGQTPIWLGGLFSPEAFVAASRQAVAQGRTWSLEQVHLQVTVNDNTPAQDSFTFEGLKLFGAVWSGNALAISNTQASCTLKSTRFTWVKREGPVGAEAKDDGTVTVPVYLDQTRQVFLFSVQLKRPSDVSASVWAQRGTCIAVWSSSDEEVLS